MGLLQRWPLLSILELDQSYQLIPWAKATTCRFHPHIGVRLPQWELEKEYIRSLLQDLNRPQGKWARWRELTCKRRGWNRTAFWKMLPHLHYQDLQPTGYAAFCDLLKTQLRRSKTITERTTASLQNDFRSPNQFHLIINWSPTWKGGNVPRGENIQIKANDAPF